MMLQRLLSILILHCALFTPFAAGQKKPELDPHDPEIERKSFKMLPGFEVNLFAAEPMLVNPIHMTWDAKGRLWVCISTTYPHVKPGQKPNDKIIILEDTNNDGKADTSTVFADGLYVPTGIELGDGGAYVANAPDLLFLKDTDGDDKADVRETVLTGFATEDNHHSISAWRWGPGGWLYFQEGTFMHSQVETPHGVVRLENGGVFQFRPRQQKLRVYADYRASNPWGHTFDRWGTGILIDNPNLYFIAPLTANSRAKLGYESSGRGIKQAGGEFVSGRHLPKEFQGQIWTNQYKTNTVTRYQVTEDGAGVSIKELSPLIRSTSRNFRPVDLKVGPDGAIYVLDWYNPLIGHMQHSFRDPRRDQSHGRVWRITAKDRPLVKKPKLVGAPIDDVVKHLKDPEDWTRYQVKRVLYDSDPKVVSKALEKFVNDLNPNEADYDHHLLEALWCYQTIDVVHEKLLKQVLSAKDARARTAGVRVLRYWHSEIEDSLKLLENAVKDPHPRVRMESVLTLGYVPDAQSVVIATRVLDKPMDRYVDHALKLTVDGLQEHWLDLHKAGKLKFDKDEHRNYALGNVITSDSVSALVAMLNSGGATVQQLEGPTRAIAQTASAAQLQPLVLSLFEQVREVGTRGRRGNDAKTLTLILEALDEAARGRGAIPENGGRMVTRCLAVPDVSVKVAAARLIGAWKLQKEANRLKGFVNDGALNPELRQAAAQSIGEVGGKQNLAFLQKLTNSNQSVDKRYLGALGLSGIEKSSAQITAKVLSADPQKANPIPLMMAHLDQKGGAEALADALTTTKPHPEVSKRLLQHLIEIGHQHPKLIKSLGGGVAEASLEGQLLRADLMKLAQEIRTKGDAARGEMIFRRQSLACMTCHGIGRAGPNIGPDLTAIGSASPPDYIVDSMLRPSKVLKEFFESVQVTTKRGRSLSGILVLKDKDKVVFRDASRGGREVTIPMSSVEELKKGPSLMPTGLVNKLKDRQEFLDLARFITELGRPGPYAASTAQIMRRWRIAPVTEELLDLKPEEVVERAMDGVPAYAMVNGTLPSSSWMESGGQVLISGQVDVTAKGKAKLTLSSTKGIGKALVDGRAVNLDEKHLIDLLPGRRTISLLVDVQKRGEVGLKLKLDDVADSSAAYKLVGGP